VDSRSLWILERKRPLLTNNFFRVRQLTLGTPTYPYVGGYYNSSGYRICCVQIGVTFTKVDLKSPRPRKTSSWPGWEFNRLTAVLTVGTSDGGPTYSSYPAGPSSFPAQHGRLATERKLWRRNMATPPISCPTKSSIRHISTPVYLKDECGSMSSRTGTQTGSTITLDNHGQSLAALFQTFGKATILTGSRGGRKLSFPTGPLYQFGVASKTPSRLVGAIAVSILHRPLWLVEN